MHHSDTWTQDGKVWTALLKTGGGMNMTFRVEGDHIDSAALTKAEVEGWHIMMRAMNNEVPPVGNIENFEI